jgi:hypothetical protein
MVDKLNGLGTCPLLSAYFLHEHGGHRALAS